MTKPKDMADLRILVAGLGSVGTRHLENLRALGCVLGVYTTGRAKPGGQPDLDGVTVHHDWAQALTKGYDGVVLANPTSLHLPLALEAARAGCHLYLEKPISHNMDGVEELAREIANRGLVGVVGCQFRFHPNLQDVRAWLEQGLGGRPLAAMMDTGAYLPDWHPWEDYRQGYAARKDLGGGVALTLIHELDYLSWLLGPLSLAGAVGGISGSLELEVEDYFTALLKGPDGLGVSLHLDYLQQPPCRRLKIVLSQGVITWDYDQGRAELIENGEIVQVSQTPSGWERNHMFKAIMADFLNAILGEGEPVSPLGDGIEALKLTMEIKSRLEPGA